MFNDNTILANLNETVVFGKLKFFYLADDKYVGQRVALGKYEPYETELMLRQINKGDVIVDVGANIGYDTILFADKVGKNGKVYAFEPDPTNFSILEKNIKANNFKNVVAINAAVSDKNGESVLYKSEDNYGDHKLYEETLRPSDTSSPLRGIHRLDRTAIKTIKLDGFIKEKVDLIKIDTQGWEVAVIKGAKKIIEKDIPIIFFEYWPKGYKEAKLNPDKMMEFFEKTYKKIFLIDDWFYIYKSLSKDKIDEICAKNKTGYADLFVKKDFGFVDRIGQAKDIRIKKVIKRIFI